MHKCRNSTFTYSAEGHFYYEHSKGGDLPRAQAPKIGQ